MSNEKTDLHGSQFTVPTRGAATGSYPYADRCAGCGLAMPIAFTAPADALLHLYFHCPSCSHDTPIIPRNRRDP